MTNFIGFAKPAYARHEPAQVLDRIEFFKPGSSNTRPEFKGIKTAGLHGGILRFCSNTRPEFKGIKTALGDTIIKLYCSNTRPEFKGIKTR